MASTAAALLLISSLFLLLVVSLLTKDLASDEHWQGKRKPAALVMGVPAMILKMFLCVPIVCSSSNGKSASRSLVHSTYSSPYMICFFTYLLLHLVFG
jgi:hypothetical protein